MGISTDGFNPFGLMSSGWSTWPVIVTPYNLPPGLCMKKEYMMLSLLIPGKHSPGNDIDVFLEPLIDELKQLWVEGVMTYDAHSKETFRLHAMVLWTINDFPAYANLSGWSTKGTVHVQYVVQNSQAFDCNIAENVVIGVTEGGCPENINIEDGKKSLMVLWRPEECHINCLEMRL